MTETNKEVPVSLTEALNAHGIALTAVMANKVLQAAGITELRWRPSSVATRPAKSYRAATPKGEQYGAVNEKNSVPSGDPILLKYLSSRFSILWNSPDVQATLADLVSRCEVRYRETDSTGVF